MKSSSSSPSSSSGISKFDSFYEERRQNEFAPFPSLVNSQMAHDNAYSKHSAWVHPAIAFQNQYPPAYMPKLSWRKGKWTEEEEIFTKKLIDAFNGGYLKVSSSTTLRSFLAERLCWLVIASYIWVLSWLALQITVLTIINHIFPQRSHAHHKEVCWVKLYRKAGLCRCRWSYRRK